MHLLPLSLSASVCPQLPYFLFRSPLSPRDNLSPCSNLPSIHIQNFVPPSILFSHLTPIFPTHQPVSPNQWQFSPVRGKEEASIPQNTRNRTSVENRNHVRHLPGERKKATDDNKNVARCHDNHSHSATVPRVWRQQNQLHVYFPSTTRLSKQEEAKKEMPPVLCPSPAREPGYLVAAGLPFSRQPSVVTSLSAEPDLSLVSTGFQSALCPGEEAQSQAGVSGPRLGAHGQHEWVAAGPRRLSANKIMSVVGKVGGGAPPNKTGSSILIKSKT